MDPIIRTEKLSKCFKGTIHALRDVDAQIKKGEVVVIDENFGVRVTEILSPLERVSDLR